MAINKEQKEEIKNLLREKIRGKLANYVRESTAMPFLAKLIQDNEKVASYSFIHSLATTLGMSIYEETARIIAAESAEEAKTKVPVENGLSQAQKSVIDKIIRELRNGVRTVNKANEVTEILKASSENARPQKEGKIADFFMKRNGKEYYFEIKTVKPNIDVFTATKKKLLEWVARRGKRVETIVAFPYNPYHPQPYERFTEQGVLEKGKEFLVGNQFWDFLGGENTFEDLLKIFDEVGKEFKQEINAKIKEVAKKKMKV